MWMFLNNIPGSIPPYLFRYGSSLFFLRFRLMLLALSLQMRVKYIPQTISKEVK